jgi:nucleoside-diphosphate-sugar epimerase
MAKSQSVLVIGGYGHIGRFLVPRLARAGWQVTVLTRGQHAPPDSDAWMNLPHRHLAANYQELTEQHRWPDLLKEVAPTVVIDILARHAPAVVHACPPSVSHVVVCGSVWMYGPPRQIPTPERTQGPFPFEFYRIRYQHLQELLAAASGPAITGVMPSNIAGPGKIPIDPYGTREIAIHKAMASGLEIVLPYDGLILVGPADAEDVAEVFALAVEQPDRSAGRMFNAAAAYALTFADLVTTYSRIYGEEIPVRSVEWDEFDLVVRPTPDQRYHHEAHMCADITAARRTLGYEPKYTPEAALQRAVEWMHAKEML